jgi:deazaflavin-dependent oxidoreductase (nitroreductase family)
MDAAVENALARGGIADITTTGRKSGLPRRIEIYFHNFDGNYYLSGRPGFKRDWVANLAAHPRFTLHLKRGAAADIPAVATLVKDPQRRWDLLFRARTESWGVDPERARRDHQHWVDTAPLVSFELEEG